MAIAQSPRENVDSVELVPPGTARHSEELRWLKAKDSKDLCTALLMSTLHYSMLEIVHLTS